MDIYLDTNLWNHLFDQAVDSDYLLASLEAKGARLVLGDEAILELAGIFTAKVANGPQKAMNLFSYLKGYTDRHIPITKSNMDLLTAEMQAIQYLMRDLYPYLNGSDYEVVRTMLDNLSRGEISDREREHIEWRKTSNASLRRGMAIYLDSQPMLRSVLLQVSLEQFPAWLLKERNSRGGIDYLAWQIKNYFPEHPFEEANEYAQALRTSYANRMAMGLIGRNLYLNWSSAHAYPNLIRRDRFPDSNHILNACYCEVYATEEVGQMDCAELLLTRATAIQFYDRNVFPSVGEWLLSITE